MRQHNENKANRVAQIMRTEDICQKRRLRLTTLRKNILEIIADNDGAIGAYDLIAACPFWKNRCAISVYRCDFETHGFIHRLESLNTYMPVKM